MPGAIASLAQWVSLICTNRIALSMGVVGLALLRSWGLRSDPIDHGFGKPGQIVRFAARDKVPIDDHRGIDPQSPGVDQIIFDTERSGRPHPPIDICGDRQPTPMADRRDAFFGIREVADKFFDLIEASQAVGPDPRRR